MISWKFHSFSFYSFWEISQNVVFSLFSPKIPLQQNCIEVHFQYPWIMFDVFLLYNTDSILLTSVILFPSKPAPKMTNHLGPLPILKTVSIVFYLYIKYIVTISARPSTELLRGVWDSGKSPSKGGDEGPEFRKIRWLYKKGGCNLGSFTLWE